MLRCGVVACCGERRNGGVAATNMASHVDRLKSCGWCGSLSAPRVCSGCRTVAFCGAECQKLSWGKHKHECAALRVRVRRHASVPPQHPSPHGVRQMIDAAAAVLAPLTCDGGDDAQTRSAMVVEPTPLHLAVGPFLVVRTTERGRGVAAARVIRAGELILACVAQPPRLCTSGSV